MRKLRLLLLAMGTFAMTNAVNADISSFKDGVFAYSITSFNESTKQGTVRIGFSAEGRENFNSDELVIPSKVQKGDSTFVVQIIGDKYAYGTPVGSKNYYYNFKNGSFKTVTIPSTVHTLDYNAFQNCVNLKTVNIQGEGLKRFRDQAFSGCEIQDIYLPSSVDDICNDFSGSGCFRGIMNVHIDNDKYKSFDGYVYSPDQSILYAIPGLKTSCVLSPKTKKVFCGAAGCGKLQNLVLNEGLEIIGELAFNGNQFKNLVIPSTVKVIGRMAFNGRIDNSSIENIQFKGSYIQSIGTEAFTNQPFEKLILPEKIDTIGFMCFWNTGIKEVRVPDYTCLDASVFTECHNLEYAYIPENVTLTNLIHGWYGDHSGMFASCEKLKKIDNYAKWDTIPAKFAYNCTSLLQYTFSDKTKHIGYNAFNGCSSIRNIKFPNSVESIDNDAFANCTQLTHVTLPSRIKRLSRYNDLPYQYTTQNGDVFINNKITEMTIPAEFEYGQKILQKPYMGDVYFYVMGDTIPQSLAYYYNSLAIKNSNYFTNEYNKLTYGGFKDWNNFSSHHNYIQEMISQGLIDEEDKSYLEFNINSPVILRKINSDNYDYVCSYLWGLTTDELRVYLDYMEIMPINDKGYLKYGNDFRAIYKYVAFDLGYKNEILESAEDYNDVFDEDDDQEVNVYGITQWLANGYGLDNSKEIFDIPVVSDKLRSKGIANFDDLYTYMENHFTEPDGPFARPHIYVKKSVYQNKYPDGKWTTTIQEYDRKTRETKNKTVTFDVGYKIPIKFKNNYMTLCRDFDVDLTDPEVTSPDLKAWLAADVDFERTAVAMQELRYIPSRTLANVEGYTGVDEYHGVVMEGKPTKTYFYKIGEQDYTQGNDQILLTDVQQVNMMCGANDDEYVYETEVNKEEENCTNYGLKNDKFKIFINEGWLNYNKSYLSLPDEIAYAKDFSLIFESLDGTTKIVNASDFAKKCEDDSTYNLQGQKVSNSYKGIVIKNGKKYMNN